MSIRVKRAANFFTFVQNRQKSAKRRNMHMKSLKASIFLFFVFIFCAVAANAQTTAAWTPEMQVKTKAVGAAQVSPDGKRVVYTVNEAVMTADKSEFVTQVWLADTDGKNAFQITFGDKSSTNPRWSPDGNWIAFTSNRKDNRNNLYVLRAAGGEAEALTDLKGSVANFEWSPDGSSIAFVTTDAKTDEEEKNDKGRNDFRWVDENIKMARLYVLPVAKDAGGKREPRKLTTENYNVAGFDWSPDGKTIVFSYTKSPVADSWTTSDISLIDVGSGKITVLANTDAAEASPVFSPDGTKIAYLASDVPVRWAQSYTIQIVGVAGGAPKQAPISFDAQPSITGWAKNGTIYFTEAKGTGTGVYGFNAGTNKITEFR